jgi:hypothetical protein
MPTRDEVLNKFQRFLNLHFPDGESNCPDWLQPPYCEDLFRIFILGKDCAMTDEDFIRFIRNNWNVTLVNHPTSDRQRQIDELCTYLNAWDTYHSCERSIS